MEIKEKECNVCFKVKLISEFYRNKEGKDGHLNKCKKCASYMAKIYNRSINGVVYNMYKHQVSHSVTRGHTPPDYTFEWFKKWVIGNDKFHLLYNKWVYSNYNRLFIPSVDRKEDSIGYIKENIQLMTWGENKEKSHKDMRSGILINGANPQKAVLQYTKDMVFIKEFVSAHQAKRETGIENTNIAKVCKNKYGYKTAGGFIWKFKNN